ncbi:PREDICTED: G2 and S phase-expressed protein 1 [Elephantulus edwardii]|uniref:G2 and S phase-expressed protein 1 n=1 Tax=Elephantulus edwardii TaxID=28737 RepID=UPI0003F05D5C|nr:PREDICTED: G2 and S phase-expressed protein 1 [Elephantulus edwardii]
MLPSGRPPPSSLALDPPFPSPTPAFPSGQLQHQDSGGPPADLWPSPRRDFWAALCMEGGGLCEGLAASPAGRAAMDAPMKDGEADRGAGGGQRGRQGTVEAEFPGVFLLADEKFDFDLSLSSSSANEDDEVFLRPDGRRATCFTGHQPRQEPLLPALESPSPWSPLTGEKFLEVSREAHLLALQIESSGQQQDADARGPAGPSGETFVQESKFKISLFEKGNDVKKSPTSLKRETYFLSESPLLGPPSRGRQPPPGLATGPGPARPPHSAPAPPGSPAPPRAPAPHSTPGLASLARTQESRPSSRSSLAAEPSATAAPGRPITQKKTASKLQMPRASSFRGKGRPSAVEKDSVELPPRGSKAAGYRRSAGGLVGAASEGFRLAAPVLSTHFVDVKPPPHLVVTCWPTRETPASPSRMKLLPEGSHRELLPKKSRASVGVATTPAGSSHVVPGKRALPVPSKVELKRTLMRPPGRTGSLAGKSASWGSLTSTVATVVGGHAKSGELASTPANDARASSGTRGQGRPRPTGPSDAGCTRTRLASGAQAPAEQPSGASTASFLQPQTPDTAGPQLDTTFTLPGSSQRSAAGGSQRRGSCLSSTPTAAPTPSRFFKRPMFSIGASPVTATPQRSRAQRPQSCASVGRVVHSTPVKPPSRPASQSLLPGPRTPTSTKCPPATPTPASRRLSSLPRMAPRTMPRSQTSLWCPSARRRSSEPRPRSGARKEAPAGKVVFLPSDSSDGSLSPPDHVPQALNFSPEKNDFTFSRNLTTEASLAEGKPVEGLPANEAVLVDIQLGGLTITPKADLPLIDLCSTPENGGEQHPPPGPGALECGSKPLIDLMINTPDRDTPLKPLPPAGQLIDLASPLIQLSPATDKENVDSPLLKF